jgi:predicted transcriptional regulator
MEYIKITILEAFIQSDNGFTVHELVHMLNRPYKSLEKRLKAYYMQSLLLRQKEGNKYRYTITEKGKTRLEYLKKGLYTI